MKRGLSTVCCVVLTVCFVFGMIPIIPVNGAQVQETAQEVQKESEETGEKQRSIVSAGNGSQDPKVVRNDICKLNDGRLYYFDTKGIKVTKKGWRKLSDKKWIQVGTYGYVVTKMEKNNNTWKYYSYNYKTDQWDKQKDVWKTIKDNRYYFNKYGTCTKIYNIKTRKCQRYKNGRMHAVKNDISCLNNEKLYYFNSRGVRDTKKGWKNLSGKRYIKVGKSGYATEKIQNTKGTWIYSKYNYHRNKWIKQKKVWITVDKKKYYFNGSGKCTRMYDISTGKYYDYKNGKGTLVKNDTRMIGRTQYYFGVSGVRVSEAGMYLTCRNKLIYVNSNGIVTKQISGQLLAYSMVNGKVASCRVKDGVNMCYYNGNPNPRRTIDTSRPMVALTYDDGPSRYTPEILSILRQHGSVATFFVVGQRVPGYADSVRNAYEMGCEIGNHTYSHQTLTKVGVSTIQSQVSATNSAVQNVIGVSPVIMRPPGGGHNPTVRSAVGMPLVMWSIDTLDWKTRNAASTQSAVLNKVRDGDIVLMHDLYSQTAAASRVIIPELVRRGYQLVTVSELSDCRGAMTSGGVYSAFR